VLGTLGIRDWGLGIRAAALILAAAPAFAQAPVRYHLSFPEAQHHRMQVEVTFPDVPPGPLHVVMSRTSPGRYAIHEFAKNVYDVQIDNAAGAPLSYARPGPSEWEVSDHSGVVRVRYKVFGDQIDGTFLGIDSTHAHLNIPAALMWARGLEERSVRIMFDGPAGWKVATQLKPTDHPRTFTAPNLHYLVDSPTELSNFTLRTFHVEQEFRIALHHTGTDADAQRFVAAVEKIVREERGVFGELPGFEAPYTFITDYLPYASSDGMEHRNSTILTGSASLSAPDQMLDVLSTAAHEFFHSWNVERLRPRSLEPFKLDAPNPSGELWFAEGFTDYYEWLVMQRSGLWNVGRLASRIGGMLDTVIRSPARKYRSAEEVSRLAQFVDQASWSDPTNFDNAFLSYYTWGAAIGLGLDLSLRTRTDHKVTLDHYMRRLWLDFGRPKPAVDGTVARPYTTKDLRRVLAEVSADPEFADDFFDRYIQGRDVVDYQQLLARAGLLLRTSGPGRAWIGPVALEFSEGAAKISAPTIEDTPAYAAGLDRGDELLSIDGAAVSGPGRLEEVIQRRKPGDRVTISIRRRGMTQDLTIAIGEDPRLHVIPVEQTGRQLTAAERTFREAWLGSKQ
jgi:predicted metalloprotease with PDZ domain